MLQSNDLAEHGLLTFQCFASPITMLQWAIENSMGQHVGHRTHWNMVEGRVKYQIWCLVAPWFIWEIKMKPRKHWSTCAELSLQLLHLVWKLFYRVEQTSNPKWENHLSQPSEPFFQCRKSVKWIKMLHSNSWKHFTHKSMALFSTFQTTVTANKIKSSDESEDIASDNHAWLTTANTSLLRKESAQRPFQASCCSLLCFLFLSHLSK